MAQDLKKQDIVNAIAEVVGKKSIAEEVVQAFFRYMTEAFAEGSSVQLQKFGRFSVSERKERTGVNPSTGKKITIPASKTVVFKASASLKEIVNNKKSTAKKKVAKKK